MHGAANLWWTFCFVHNQLNASSVTETKGKIAPAFAG
jgi:hypothetical protein